MELKAVPDGSRPTRFHSAVADPAERQRQREDLGDALDREGDLGIAGEIDVAIDRDDRHAELLRIDRRKLRNVVGDFAARLPRTDGCVGCRRQWPARSTMRLPSG